MTPYKHQEEISEKAIKILKSYGLVYLAMSPRTGKTLTSILICEKSTKHNNILVLTPKNAIKGFNDILNNFNHSKKYTVTNHEQANKLKASDYDMVIIDESHRLGTYPKPSQRWKAIKELTKNKLIIFLSGTPSVESKSQIYHQMQLSSFSPFKQYKNFYSWFAHYGIPKTLFLNGRQVAQYNETVDSLNIDHLFITFTQKDLKINEAKIIKESIPLTKETQQTLKTILDDNYIVINDKEIVCDSTMKLRTTLHQIENGTHKDIGILNNTEKIDWIKDNFKTDNIAIMAHYKLEREMLSKHFKNIYSSTSHAEGVDLSHYEALIVYSQDYSGSKWLQRTDRLTNIAKGGATGNIHVLTSPNAISSLVYKAVSNKQDFNNNFFNSHKGELCT